MCFRFSLNPLKFSLAIEADMWTYKTSWVIWKTLILEKNPLGPRQLGKMGVFGQFHHSRIEFLQNCSVFLCQFLSWEKIWENWEINFHKIPTLATFRPTRWQTLTRPPPWTSLARQGPPPCCKRRTREWLDTTYTPKGLLYWAYNYEANIFWSNIFIQVM